MKKIILLLTVVFSLSLLTACGDGTTEGTKGLGETFEFDGLEITLSDEIGFAIFRDRWSDRDGSYMFYIPATVTNIGNISNGLHEWSFTIFSPEDVSIDSISWEMAETSITLVGSVQPDATKTGNIYVLYSEDGEYVIEFNNGYTVIEVVFELEFDFDAVSVIQTEFSIGETIDFEGMEITILDDISWGRINSRHSAHDGAYYFYFPIILANNSGESNGFPTWSVTTFGPNGHELEHIPWEISEYDVSRAGILRDGATHESYIHFLFTGNGQYTMEFSSWEFFSNLYLFFEVEFDEFAVPIVQTEFSLGEMFEFEGLEITFEDDISWGIIDSRWSDLDGEYYFLLPVTVANISDSSTSFPWNVTTFDPNGREINDNIISLVENNDITRSGDIRTKATIESYFHILFNGSGEYVIELDSWRDNITIQVLFVVGEPAATNSASANDESIDNDDANNGEVVDWRAFLDEYDDLVTRILANPNDLSLAAKFLDWVERSEDVMASLDFDELLEYIERYLTITERLLD